MTNRTLPTLFPTADEGFRPRERRRRDLEEEFTLVASALREIRDADPVRMLKYQAQATALMMKLQALDLEAD